MQNHICYMTLVLLKTRFYTHASTHTHIHFWEGIKYNKVSFNSHILCIHVVCRIMTSFLFSTYAVIMVNTCVPRLVGFAALIDKLIV